MKTSMKRKTHFPFPITQSPLIAIVGPTASGKTSLAIDIATQFNGEIICADSRSIYQGADIGTAKPSIAQQKKVPHWGLDLVKPGEYYSVADFKTYADQKIAEIRSRGHIPFLVGGTGLYIDAVILDYKFGPPVDSKLRSSLQRMTTDELYAYCEKNNIKLPENYKNKRYLIRSIEKNDIHVKKRRIPLKSTIVVGITTNKTVLRSRINTRTEQLFKDGVINETKLLGEMYGWDNQVMTSNIYPLIHSYFDGDMSINDVKEKFKTLDWRLAKRQLTWLRRNSFIHWLSLDEAKDYLIDTLAIRK